MMMMIDVAGCHVLGFLAKLDSVPNCDVIYVTACCHDAIDHEINNQLHLPVGFSHISLSDKLTIWN